MKLTVTGLDELARALAGAEAEIERVLERAGTDAIREMGPHFRAETPYRSGDLVRSEDLFQATPASVTFEATMDYASFVNDGTRFQRANPFVDRSVDQSRPRVALIYELGMRQFADAFES